MQKVVGHKTASVFMNKAFSNPALTIDTYIHRLMWHWNLTN